MCWKPYPQATVTLIGNQLTDIQRVEKLLAMLAISQQKLLELLAKMLRISLPGEDNSVFSTASPSRRYPESCGSCSRRVLVGRQLISGRLDKGLGFNAQVHDDSVAAVSLDQETRDAVVAAIQPWHSPRATAEAASCRVGWHPWTKIGEEYFSSSWCLPTCMMSAYLYDIFPLDDVCLPV